MAKGNFKAPSLDEIRENEAEKKLLSQEDDVLLAAVLKMPERRKRLVVQMLALAGRKPFEQMYRDAGYAHGRPSTIKKQLIGKLGKAFADIGLSEFDIASKLFELMNATKRVPIFNPQGEFVMMDEQPDNSIRLATIKHVTVLSGYMAPAKLDFGGKVRHTHELTATEAAMLKARQQHILQQTKEIESHFEVVDESSGPTNA